jgi:hypothetical protein
MAKVANNINTGLSGSLGKQLVLKGRTAIVSKFPVFDENRTFTEACKTAEQFRRRGV